jgi:hypothetical protein
MTKAVVVERRVPGIGVIAIKSASVIIIVTRRLAERGSSERVD